MWKIVIPFSPVAWSSHGGYGKFSYNRRAKERKIYVEIIKSAWKIDQLYGALRLNFLFNMAIPKSYSENKRRSLIGKYHIKRPDTSNMIKFTEDCLKNIVLMDDSQVSSLSAKKLYALKGSVEIEVEEISRRIEGPHSLN